jgi:hypothetical protein
MTASLNGPCVPRFILPTWLSSAAGNPGVQCVLDRLTTIFAAFMGKGGLNSAISIQFKSTSCAVLPYRMICCSLRTWRHQQRLMIQGMQIMCSYNLESVCPW